MHRSRARPAGGSQALARDVAIPDPHDAVKPTPRGDAGYLIYITLSDIVLRRAQWSAPGDSVLL